MSNASPSTWMPVTWGDYLKNTMNFSAEEHGAYFLLIAYYWSEGGPVRYDERDVEQVTKLPVAKLSKVLAKFRIENGFMYHDRVDEELLKASDNIRKSAERTAAATAARKAKRDNVTNNVTLDVTTYTSPSPSPISSEDKSSSDNISPPLKKPKEYTEGFLAFWSQYPANGASKGEAFKSWRRAIKNGAEENAILGSIAEYCAYLTRTGTATAHATTWLNQQRWTIDYNSLTGNASSQRGGYQKPASGNWDNAWGGAAQRDRESKL